MFSFLGLFENVRDLGGLAARTAVSVAVPVPGAGIVFSPVASMYGEAVGEIIPSNKVPKIMKDSVNIYKYGGSKNTSFSPKDQISVRADYVKKAKSLDYNKIGQSVAAIDPGLLSIIPNSVVKKQ